MHCMLQSTLQTNFQDLPGTSKALARFLMAVIGILTVDVSARLSEANQVAHPKDV